MNVRLNEAQRAQGRWIPREAWPDSEERRCAWWEAFCATWYVIAWNYRWGFTLWLASGIIDDRTAQDHSVWYGEPSQSERVEVATALDRACNGTTRVYTAAIESGWIETMTVDARWDDFLNAWHDLANAISYVVHCGGFRGGFP